MNRACHWFLTTGLMLLLSAPLSAATSWDHVPVWPKSQRVQLLDSPDNQRVVAEASEIEWPATVEKTDGQWLKISDPGSYSAVPIEGWLRKDDILRQESVQDYCTAKIRAGEGQHRLSGSNGKTSTEFKSPALADSYWIRGVYWETQGDTENAIADYNKAIARGMENGDIYLRLARMQNACAAHFEDQDFNGSSEICECANKNFAQAERLFRNSRNGIPAQYYIALGDSNAARFSSSGDVKYSKQAMDAYCKAEQCNTSWALPAYKQGKLRLIPIEQADKKDSTQAPDTHTLLLVIQDLSQAIRLDPNCTEAYEDRAQALRLLKKSMSVPKTAPVLASQDEGNEGERDRPSLLHLPVNPSSNWALTLLEQANNSADRAYLLSNNRGARALEIKAKVEHDIAEELYDPSHRLSKVDQTAMSSAKSDRTASTASKPDRTTNAPSLPDRVSRARMERAYGLYMDAMELAKSAADHSADFNDIVDRISMALDYYDTVNNVADDLSERSNTKIATNPSLVKTKLALAESDLNREKKSLEKLKSDDPQRAILLANAAEAQQRIDEAKSALAEGGSKMGDPEIDRAIRGKINDAGTALMHLGKTGLSETVAGAPIKPFRSSESHGAALLETTEEAPVVSRPPRPTYTPLYLDSR